MADTPFWLDSDLEEANVDPNILAIGDSWFWYLFNNILTPLNNMINTGDKMTSNMLVRGALGAEVDAFVDTTFLDQLDEDLGVVRDQNGDIDVLNYDIEAVFLSGGGNDVVDDNLRHILNPDNTGVTQPEDCFNQTNFDDRLNRIRSNYNNLIDFVQLRQPNAKIFMHCYDYAPPTGVKFLNFVGGWLREPMEDANIDPALYMGVVHVLIDNLISIMEDISQHDNNIFFINSTGALPSINDWANELHPTSIGFTHVLERRWRPVLQHAGLI